MDTGWVCPREKEGGGAGGGVGHLCQRWGKLEI